MWSYLQYKKIAKATKEDDLNRQHELETPNSTELDKPKEAESPIGSKSDHDRILVQTAGQNDPFDPQNWPLTSRSKNLAILGFLVFTQAWAGAADSMANTAASQEFHVSKVTQSLSTALYLFGIGSGCLLVGPLSETVGRNPTFLVPTFFYLLFVLGSALAKTAGAMYVCRYFVGLFASATLGINGASVKDQFRPVKQSFVFPFLAWVNVARRFDWTFSFTLC